MYSSLHTTLNERCVALYGLSTTMLEAESHSERNKLRTLAQQMIKDAEQVVAHIDYEVLDVVDMLYVFLKEWITEHYGATEADDPSYDIASLVEALIRRFNIETV